MGACARTGSRCRWPDPTGPGHWLPHPRASGLAPVARWPGDDSRRRAGARPDKRFATLGRVSREFLPRPHQGARHRFESIQHAARATGDRIQFHDNRRPHQALAMRTPAEVCRSHEAMAGTIVSQASGLIALPLAVIGQTADGELKRSKHQLQMTVSFEA